METTKINKTVSDMTNEDARKKIDQIKSRVNIKKGVGARSKEERESLELNSPSYATPSSLKVRTVDWSLPPLILKGKRISVQIEGSQSVTFERQDMEIAKIAKNDGISLDNAIIFEDEVSGWKRKYRPEFDAMIKFIEEFEGANPIYLYFYDLDRITRNEEVANIVFSILRRQNVKLRLATMPNLNINDDQSSLIINLLIQLAQGESKKTSLRTTGGQEVRAKKGIWRNSVAPYGMEVTKSIIDGVERSILQPGDNADVVKDIFYRASLGDSINEIVRYLNNKCVLAPGSATIWRDTTVKFILLNPHYAGFTRYNSKREHKLYDVEKQIIKNDNGAYLITHEGIVTPEEFFTVLHILNGKRSVVKKNRNTYILSGILYCAECKKVKLYGNKSTVSSYRCPDSTRDSKVTSNSISCSGIEEVIKRYAKHIIANPKLLKELSAKPILNLEEDELARQIIIDKIKDIEIRMSNETIDYMMESLKSAYAKATKDLEEYNSNKEINTKYASRALASPDVFEEMWNAKNKTAILMALKTIIERIDVEPLGDRKKLNTTLLNKKGWLFDYTRVSITWANGTTIKLSEEFDKANEVLYK